MTPATPMTPPLTRQNVREANAALRAVKHLPLPSGRLQATYEVHGITVTESIEPTRRPA